MCWFTLTPWCFTTCDIFEFFQSQVLHYYSQMLTTCNVLSFSFSNNSLSFSNTIDSLLWFQHRKFRKEWTKLYCTSKMEWASWGRTKFWNRHGGMHLKRKKNSIYMWQKVAYVSKESYTRLEKEEQSFEIGMEVCIWREKKIQYTYMWHRVAYVSKESYTKSFKTKAHAIQRS